MKGVRRYAGKKEWDEIRLLGETRDAKVPLLILSYFRKIAYVGDGV